MSFIGLAVICIIVILLAVWLLTYVTIEIYAEKNKLNGGASVWVKYLFFKKQITGSKKEKTEKTKKNDSEEYKIKADKSLKIFNALKGDIADILKYCQEKLIIFEEIDISVNFGLDDPMETGIANGILYGLIYEILGFVHNNSHVKKITTDIVPDFEKSLFAARFKCILKLKNAHITVMLVKMVKLYKKLKKIKKN